MRSQFYENIKNRAIELLQSGGIDNRSIDELRSGEGCTRSYCIGIAIVTALDELKRREQSWLADRRRCILTRGDHRKAMREIAKYVMEAKMTQVSDAIPARRNTTVTS